MPLGEKSIVKQREIVLSERFIYCIIWNSLISNVFLHCCNPKQIVINRVMFPSLEYIFAFVVLGIINFVLETIMLQECLLKLFRCLSWCCHDVVVEEKDKLPFTSNLPSKWTVCNCCLVIFIPTTRVNPRTSYNGNDNFTYPCCYVRCCKVIWAI